MNKQLTQLLSFLHHAEKLKSTLRHNWTTTGRQESTAEHTWRLLLLYTLLQHHCNFKVDVLKVLKMLLIHDLPEVIFGDIPGFKKVQKDREKEWEGAQQLFSTLPLLLKNEFLSLVKEYDEAKTLEAKVAKACDRLETILQHYEAGIEYMTEEEMGDHTSSYGKEQVKALNDHQVTELYEYLQKELEIMMKTE